MTARHAIARSLAAEGLGSLLLSATVVGSGVMAVRLAGGNAAIALLANTLATVLVLAVLIGLLQPVSGAHFNPAVSIVAALSRRLSWRTTLAYSATQVIGCCAGVALAHTMFDLTVAQLSTRQRSGPGQWLAEFVATAGLLFVIGGCRRPEQAPWLVAGWIGAAYWFTASTSFANPAITIGRSLTDTFAGIRPHDAPAFIAAQLAGAVAGWLLARLLFPATPATA